MDDKFLDVIAELVSDKRREIQRINGEISSTEDSIRGVKIEIAALEIVTRIIRRESHARIEVEL